MKDLFGNNTPITPRNRSRKGVINDYDGFVEKFKPKKTTDDCYTPQPVYDAILGWVRENADIEGREIVRPFYPGGDYEHYDYPDGCVVIDNPPFSIISRIARFYTTTNIRFFLFAPHLTLFSTKGIEWIGIVCFCNIEYENGARVKTDFISNLFGDIRIMTAPELHWRVKNAQDKAKQPKTLPKYIYPDNITSSALLGRIAPYVDFQVKASECSKVSKLECQEGKGIFGGGFLLSETATKRKVEAERKAKEKAANMAIERKGLYVWQLSEREKKIISELE